MVVKQPQIPPEPEDIDMHTVHVAGKETGPGILTNEKLISSVIPGDPGYLIQRSYSGGVDFFIGEV